MKKTLSIVIPVYNERENIKQLYSELDAVTSKIDYQTEIIFVDDGSTDGTRAVLEDLSRDRKVKIIMLSRNYGQTPAIATGINNATGSIIITMDSDLQNNPADIPLLLTKMEEGYDVVSGWRKNRKDKLVSRRLPSKTANFIISWMTGVKLHDYGCTLKAYKSEILKNFAIYGEMHRFLPAYCAWHGANVTEFVVNHRPRTHGQSKYGINRIFKVILDMLVVKFLLTYLTRPIYVFGGIAGGLFLLGCAVNLFVIIRKLYFHGMWLSPMFFIGFLLWSISVICILLGLIMEVIVRGYMESKNEPPFRIGKKINI